jgi:hypothetical protein
VRFRATLQLGGKTATGIEVPTEVVERLGAGKRPPVRVTIKGHSYRTTIAPMGGRFMLPVSADNRTSAGVVAGDEVDIDVALDTEPREVSVPPDLAEALDADPTPSSTSMGCRTATSCATCSRSREPRRPRLGSGVSPRRSARYARAEPDPDSDRRLQGDRERVMTSRGGMQR